MAFAVRTAGVASGGSSSGTGNRTATFTPAVGDLVVVYCCVAANTNDTPTCSDDNSGTYDLIDTLNFAISTVNYRLSVFIRTALMVNTTSTTITVATGSNTSGTIHVVPCTGVTRTGANAVRSKGSQNNQAAGTAAPTLNQAALTNNGTLVAQGSADTTTTPPTNWIEILDTSQINDSVALESASRASGFTGTTITFGAASSTQFCAHAMEIDITVPLTQSASDDVNNLADARGLGYGNLHADSLNALTDTAQIVLGYSVAATDTVTLSDGEARLLGTQTTLADTLATLSDANAQLLGYLLALADSEAANWADSHQLLLAQRLALAEDTHLNAAFLDDVSPQLDYLTSFSDSFSLTDSESHLLVTALDFSDSIDNLADSITTTPGLSLADAGPFVHTTPSSSANVLFLEAAGASTGGTHLYNQTGGAPTIDTTIKPSGAYSSIKLVDGGEWVRTACPGIGRISFYFYAEALPAANQPLVFTEDASGSPDPVIDLRVGSDGLLHWHPVTGAAETAGSQVLSTGTWYHLTLCFNDNGTVDNLDAKVYVNGTLDISVTGQGSNSITAGQFRFLGPSDSDGGPFHFAHIYLDDGSDLSDTGDIRTTAKFPTTVNDDQFDTTGGTGAVNERPLSESNYRQQAGSSQARQNYNLQSASAGDVDISGTTIVGFSGWIWAKKSTPIGGAGSPALTLDGTDYAITGIGTTPVKFLKHLTQSSYPSNVAAIGLVSGGTSVDFFLYECGVVVAYRPESAVENDSIALGYGLLTSDSISLTDAFTKQLHVISSVLELELDDQLSLDDSCALGHGLSCVDSVSLTDSVALSLDYFIQLDDALAPLADSIVFQLGQLAAFSDSFTLTDSELTTLGYEEQATDTLVLTDAETNGLSYQLTFTETITLTDSLALGVGLIFSDTIATLTDSISTQLDHLLNFSDSLIITDSVVITLGYEESASDSLLLIDVETYQLGQLYAFSDILVLTDEVALGFGLLFTDSIATLTDAVSVRLNELLDFSDSLTLADSVSLRLTYELQFADSIDNLLDNESQQLEQRLTFTDSLNSLTDSLTFTLGETLSFSDSLALTDSLVLGYGLALTDDASFLMDDILTSAPQGPLREVGVTDALTLLADEVSLRLDYLLSVADTVANLDDSSALIEGLRTSFSDLFALSDSIFPTLTHLLPLTDTLVFSDSIQLQVGYEIANADVLSLSDNISLRVSYNLTLSDNFTFTDDVQLNLSYRTQLTDSFTLTDSIATALNYNQSLADSLTLTDSVQLRLGYELIASDLIALTDSFIPTLTYLLSLADNVALLADSIALTPGLALIITDNGPVFTDSASLFSTGQLQLSDALALTDSLAKFSAGFIQFEDTLVISDSVAIDLRGPDLDEALSDSLLLADAISISLGDELRIELQLTDLVTLSDHYFDLRHPYTPSAKRHIVVPSRARVTIPAKRTGIVVPPSPRTTKVE